MARARELDCESTAAGCRSIIRSEDAAEAIELVKRHTRDVHGEDYTDEELRSEHLRIVQERDYVD